MRQRRYFHSKFSSFSVPQPTTEDVLSAPLVISRCMSDWKLPCENMLFKTWKKLCFYVFSSKGMNVDVKSLSTYENGMAIISAFQPALL